MVVVGLEFFAFGLVFDELFVFFSLQFFDFFPVACIDVLLDGSDFTQENREQVAQWLHEIAAPETQDVNRRKLEEALSIYKFQQRKGEHMSFEEFAELDKPLIEGEDQRYEMLYIIVNEVETSTKERVQASRDRTGDSRRTFCRVRDDLVEKSEKAKEIVKG